LGSLVGSEKKICFIFFPWIFLGLVSQSWLFSVILGIVLVEPHDEHCPFLNEARDDFWGYLTCRICQSKENTQRDPLEAGIENPRLRWSYGEKGY